MALRPTVTSSPGGVAGAGSRPQTVGLRPTKNDRARFRFLLNQHNQAWWDYKKFFGMGTLRVCSAKAMLEVRVTVTSKDEKLARKITQTIAQKVLASQ